MAKIKMEIETPRIPNVLYIKDRSATNNGLRRNIGIEDLTEEEALAVAEDMKIAFMAHYQKMKKNQR